MTPIPFASALATGRGQCVTCKNVVTRVLAKNGLGSREWFTCDITSRAYVQHVCPSGQNEQTRRAA